MAAHARRCIVLDARDNVVVVTDPAGAAADETVDLEGGGSLVFRAAVPRGHKAASRPIAKGSPILKFGHVIGVATADIEPGEHVHVHNVEMPTSDFVNAGGQVEIRPLRSEWGDLPATFDGYLRPNGAAGIRNYVVVAGSVNCSATVVKAVCRRFVGADLSRYGVDGVVPVTHASGCAQAIGGESYQVLNRTLAGWIFHPNVVGAVVIGLGCEGTTFKSILRTKQELELTSEIPLEHFGIQEVGGTAEAIARGIECVERVLAALPRFERVEVPVSKLNLALNCGGSDALSSLTANPALGGVSDVLVSKGGTVALAEIPECTGCEELLYERCVTAEARDRLRALFDWWEDYASRNRVTLNENLAPGNIAGGITTIVEKSLGAVAKGGSTPLTEVVGYAEPITATGFTLMNTPGFDPVSVTGLVAGGCNIVAFTTGRGSVYGCSIAPTIKVATNSELFRRMPGDMDVDAGKVLADGSTDAVVAEIYRLVVEVASGRQTCSEQLGLGWEEFAPWPVGETL